MKCINKQKVSRIQKLCNKDNLNNKKNNKENYDINNNADENPASLKTKSRKIYRLSELAESNLYNVLEISDSASKEEIKNAYKILSKKYHPDKLSGNTEKFQKVNEAYHILENSLTRQIYDRFGTPSIKFVNDIINKNMLLNENVVLECLESDDLESLQVYIEKL